jgi:hypothetical protein
MKLMKIKSNIGQTIKYNSKDEGEVVLLKRDNKDQIKYQISNIYNFRRKEGLGPLSVFPARSKTQYNI